MVEVTITDRPDPPTKPTIYDVNYDSVRLRWSAPVQDGGSPVRLYTVEKQSKGSDKVKKTKKYSKLYKNCMYNRPSIIGTPTVAENSFQLSNRSRYENQNVYKT